MRILITGMAGFIGYHLAAKLVKSGHSILGIDSINEYYDTDLKFGRLRELGIDSAEASAFGKHTLSKRYGKNLSFIRMKLEDTSALPKIFESSDFDAVCNMAAQAGVRYSLEKPMEYVDSNLVGFVNLLECCRHNNVRHFIYASSSSVYGLSDDVPFSESQNVDHPISLYAATKKSNELMAHTYSHLYGLPTTGLRFFTVYGPWGRPDMALFLFTKAILNNLPINVFNHGRLERDFTYIDDIVSGMEEIIDADLRTRKEPQEHFKLYNIGRGKPIKLMDFISQIEDATGKKARLNMMPMQPGDVNRTWASTEALASDYGYEPTTSLSEGIHEFVKWYRSYYNP